MKVTDGGQTFKVTYQDAVAITLSLLYYAPNSPSLGRFLEDLHEANGAAGQRTARGGAAPEVDVPDVPAVAQRSSGRKTARNGRRPTSGWSGSPGWAAWTPPTLRRSPHGRSYARVADARAPGFGALWTYVSTPCATWPAKDPNRYQGPWDKETANPLLLVGNSRGDPATPYDDARTTATRRLADARLLTLNSYGHTASYGGQSRCIDAAVDRYFVEGKLPPKGKVCQPNFGPFAPSPRLSK